MPSTQQINSSELFALHAPTPRKNKSENDDEDEEGPQDEAVYNLALACSTLGESISLRAS